MTGTALWGGSALWADPNLSWDGRRAYTPGSSLTVTIEVEFTSGVWTDISAYHLATDELTIRRGRNTPLDQAQVGTCSFSLIGDDGRFSPGYNGSPYYPNVLPDKQVRVSVNGYTRFTGYIDRWEPTFPSGGANNIIIQVTASDAMRLIARRSLMSTFAEHCKSVSTTSAGLWTCAEGGTTFKDSLGYKGNASLVRPRTYWGSYSDSQDAGVPYGDKGVSTTPGAYPAPFDSRRGGRVVQLPVKAPATSWILAWWSKPAEDGTNWHFSGAGAYTAPGPVSGAVDYGVVYSSGWILTHSSGTNSVGYGSVLSVNPAPVAGQTYHIAIVCDTTKLHLYVNGVEVGSGVSLSSPVASTRYPYVGGHYNSQAWDQSLASLSDALILGNVYDTVGGVTADIFYDEGYAYTATDVLALYNAGANGFNGDLAIDRATRIASYMAGPYGLSTAYYANDTLRTGPLSTEGRDVVALGQELAEAAEGIWYANESGSVMWTDSTTYGTYYAYATFDNEADTTGTEFAQPIENSRIVNSVTITASGGGSYTAKDQTSIDTIGLVEVSKDLCLYDYAHARDRAAWWLARYGSAQPRLGSVEIDMLTSSTPTIVDDVFGLLGFGLGTRFRVTGLPAYGPASQVDAHIEGYTERYSMTSARVILDTSPADWPALLCIADNTAPYNTAEYDLVARLDCDGSQTVNTTINASATTLVAAVPGVAFTRTDVPFDIELDGEILTVTAAAAVSAGTQSLTVTRGVYGTNARSHTAGTAIYMAHTPRLGL